MAKSKNFFGLRRGSTKSLTFSVLNGQQVTKDRVYGGKNPRTLAQMQQRMAMATSSAAYAAMKEIVDHSFEGISYGANTMAEFLKVNTKLVKSAMFEDSPKFGFNPYGDRGLKFGAYKMSQGNLSAVKESGDVEDINISTIVTALNDNTIAVGLNAMAGTSPNFYISTNSLMKSQGLQVGDMVTACFVFAKNNSPENLFGFVRFRILQASDEPLTTANYSQYVAVESNWPISVEIDATRNGILVTLACDSDNTLMPGFCWIKSAQRNGKWMRSTTSLKWPSGTEFLEAYDDAIATYPVGESYILNGGEVE